MRISFISFWLKKTSHQNLVQSIGESETFFYWVQVFFGKSYVYDINVDDEGSSAQIWMQMVS